MSLPTIHRRLQSLASQLVHKLKAANFGGFYLFIKNRSSPYKRHNNKDDYWLLKGIPDGKGCEKKQEWLLKGIPYGKGREKTRKIGY